MSRYATAADGARISYELDGAGGPWCVLVHGLGYGGWGWGPLRAALRRRLRLVVVDNRGVGGSDVTPGPYSAAQMAGDVIAALDHAGIDRASVVGLSLGGMIAQELALAVPARLDRLVLLASTPGGASAFPIPGPTLRLIEQASSMERGAALRALTANAFAPATARERPELVDEVVRLREANLQDPAGWQAQAAAGTGYDGGGRQRDIVAPVLVLHGTEDRVVDPRNAAVLGDLLPRARVEYLSGAGHLLPYEQPERVAGLVGGFLTGDRKDGE